MNAEPQNADQTAGNEESNEEFGDERDATIESLTKKVEDLEKKVVYLTTQNAHLSGRLSGIQEGRDQTARSLDIAYASVHYRAQPEYVAPIQPYQPPAAPVVQAPAAAPPKKKKFTGCFKCGEEGHIKDTCPAPDTDPRVVKRAAKRAEFEAKKKAKTQA